MEMNEGIAMIRRYTKAYGGEVTKYRHQQLLQWFAHSTMRKTPPPPASATVMF